MIKKDDFEKLQSNSLTWNAILETAQEKQNKYSASIRRGSLASLKI